MAKIDSEVTADASASDAVLFFPLLLPLPSIIPPRGLPD
eukprot:CAMPEP_0114167620 /NCGR_PEP_ID=MMETSP0043_2-20121206/32520_1 /TAXON_ID=464988 /ORGANISM="Hemiselmis andersenii, Strain CCMP644" /LENGTH=38 /DNA_ID= /DNA_START= /DNA_END= /DNA_ORIENTATION=